MNKKNQPKIYAKALAEVLSKTASVKTTAWQGKITDNFLKLLIKEGLEKKANEILNLAEDLLLLKQGNKKIIFQTARKITASQRKLLEKLAKSGDVVKEKINLELIAGVKIIINESQQFDASLQSRLQKLTI